MPEAWILSHQVHQMLSVPLCLVTWTSILVLSLSVPRSCNTRVAWGTGCSPGNGGSWAGLLFWWARRHDTETWSKSLSFLLYNQILCFHSNGFWQSSSRPHKAKFTPFGHGFDVFSPRATRLHLSLTSPRPLPDAPSSGCLQLTTAGGGGVRRCRGNDTDSKGFQYRTSLS